jgi:malate synthase
MTESSSAGDLKFTHELHDFIDNQALPGVGVCNRDQRMGTMKRMAIVVDCQYVDYLLYSDMAPGFDGVTFKAACDLVFMGAGWPNGHAEQAQHVRQLEMKTEA